MAKDVSVSTEKKTHMLQEKGMAIGHDTMPRDECPTQTFQFFDSKDPFNVIYSFLEGNHTTPHSNLVIMPGISKD